MNELLNEELSEYEITICKSNPDYDNYTTIEVLLPDGSELLGMGLSMKEAIADLIDTIMRIFSTNQD